MTLTEIMKLVREKVGEGKLIYECNGSHFPLFNITKYGEIVATYNVKTSKLVIKE